jgi:magnesium-transporting ATPase (P-type)
MVQQHPGEKDGHAHDRCGPLGSNPDLYIHIVLQGASEIVLKRCDNVLEESGAVRRMTDADQVVLNDNVTDMASRGLRTLALSFRDFTPQQSLEPDVFQFPPEEQLTLCCIVGIKVGIPNIFPLGVRAGSCEGLGGNPKYRPPENHGRKL